MTLKNTLDLGYSNVKGAKENLRITLELSDLTIGLMEATRDRIGR